MNNQKGTKDIAEILSQRDHRHECTKVLIEWLIKISKGQTQERLKMPKKPESLNLDKPTEAERLLKRPINN